MKRLFTYIVAIMLLFISSVSIAQPLPCPPLRTTTIDGTGATTICRGNSTTLGNTHTTAIKSTSSYGFSTIPYLPTAYDGSGNTGGTGNVLIRVDDEYTSVVPIPFDFCFYGTKYNSCVIGANGEICFNTSLAGSSCPWSISGPIPGTASELNDATLNTIMGVYQDIDPELGGTVNWAVFGSAPCRTFVVSWLSVPYFTTGICDGDTCTQQIVLYESTYAIDIFVKHKPICTGWNGGLAILGLCDQSGANYNIPAAYNATAFSLDNAGFRFTPSAPATWSYVWNGPGGIVGTDSSVTVSPLVTTTYTVTGIASTNCDSYKVTSPVVVTVNPRISISHTSFTDPTLCGACDGSITLFGLPPGVVDTIFYKYNGVLQAKVIQTAAADSSLVLTGLCADVTGATGGVGTYDSITVNETGGCSTVPVGPIRLTNPPITISFVGTSNPSTYCTNDGELILNGLYPAHTYTVTFDKNGTPQTPVAATSGSDGKITITGLSGTEPTGDVYSNIVAAFPACTTPPKGPYTLLGPPSTIVNIIGFVNPSQCGYCDGSITLSSVPPFSIDTVTFKRNGVLQPAFVTAARADSTIFIPNMCDKSIYTNILVKIGVCTSAVPGSAILQAPPIVDSFYDVIHLGCNGDTVFYYNQSHASGPLFYEWNFGDGYTSAETNPMHIFAQGVYTVTLSAGDNICTDTMQVTDSMVHPLRAGFTNDNTIICQGQTINFTNTSAGTAVGYAWTFGANTGNGSGNTNASYTYNKMGTYHVQLIATDFVPCSDTATTTIYVDSLSPISMNVTDSVLCRSTDITFTGTYTSSGNTGITWNFGDGSTIVDQNPVVHAYDAAGTFIVTAVAHFRACKDESTIKEVTVFPQPVINLGADTAICPGSEAITLGDQSGGTAGATWLWSTGQRTSSIAISEPGVYSAVVNINGCYSSDSITVLRDCYMNIPNVFTPNNDGLNDYFYPRQLLTRGLTSFNMTIYNRWGQLVFSTTTLDGRGWDGKFNAADQPEGVYVYIIDATFKDGQKEHHQGNVTLMR